MANYSYPFKASNDQTAMELYAQRTHYRETTEDIFDDLPNFVDLWYKTPYYGKADLKGNLVIVKPNSLKFSMGEKSKRVRKIGTWAGAMTQNRLFYL